MGRLALIGLGSNLGDRKVYLDAAVAALAETPGVAVRAVSSYRETAPVGGPGGQGAYLNAAASAETTLDPAGLLAALQAIERREGRVRSVTWGERTLDLDLLLFGDQVLDTQELKLPHPRMNFRRFVLAPSAEIVPEAVDPRTGRSIADLLANIDRRPSYVALSGPPATKRRVFRRLVAALSAAGLSEARDRFPRSDGQDARMERRTWACLRQRAGELRADRWSTRLWGDRWIVTDFSFDELVDHGGRYVDASRRATFLERFLKARARVIQPTFKVHTGGDFPGDLMRRTAPSPTGQDTGSDIPVLIPTTIDPEAIVSEILVACAASRGG